MLLLTNCKVHTGKYSDRSFEVRTERTKRGPYETLRSEYFPVQTELKSGKKCLDPNLKNEVTRSILKINKQFIAHFNR